MRSRAAGSHPTGRLARLVGDKAARAGSHRRQARLCRPGRPAAIESCSDLQELTVTLPAAVGLLPKRSDTSSAGDYISRPPGSVRVQVLDMPTTLTILEQHGPNHLGL